MRGKTSHERQRQLRRQQTKAEARLWHLLRNRRLCGAKFRRQHRIGPYIADFVCLEARLVVELDGSQHLAQSGHDAARTRFLNALGFRVLRFWNDAMFNEQTDVLAAIVEALWNAPHPASPPSPRKRGEDK